MFPPDCATLLERGAGIADISALLGPERTCASFEEPFLRVCALLMALTAPK